MTSDTETLGLIWGIAAIAKLIGRTDRQTFHLVNSGQIPAKKLNGRWVIERSKLVAVFTGEVA